MELLAAKSIIPLKYLVSLNHIFNQFGIGLFKGQRQRQKYNVCKCPEVYFLLILNKRYIPAYCTLFNVKYDIKRSAGSFASLLHLFVLLVI